jgi:hypothetical protein
MAANLTFGTTVAARTRAADFIRKTPDLLKLYEDRGGLRSDLDRIVEAGESAELLSQARSAVQASGSAATTVVLKQFFDLQRDYVAVMAVVQAVRNDLDDAGADADTLASVDKILAFETPVVIRTVEKEGVKKKAAAKSKSQEALRAEIQKDASALLELPVVLKPMAKRKVTVKRIEALRDAAAALAGKLAERTAAKGAGVGATKGVRDAVHEQKRVWSACYRILALVGQADERFRSLLAAAAA